MFPRPVVIALLALAATGDRAAAQRVLVVDIDDVGHGLVEDTPTPLFDQLDARGVRFTSFYSTPGCSPTRAQLTLGAFGSHPDSLVGNRIDKNGTYSLSLAPLEPLARVVHAAGYRTAKVGKWHLSPETHFHHPHQAGWNEYRGAMSNVGPAANGYYDYEKVVNGTASQVTGTYLTTDETEDGIDFLLQGVELVSVSYHAVHGPVHIPPSHLFSIVPTTPYDKVRAALQALDRELTRLLRVAFAQGYIVLILSDNGTSATFGGGKASVYENGVNVPAWATGPGVVPGVDGDLVGAVDVYATVCEVFGIAQSPTRGPDSRSFLPRLYGSRTGRSWMYAERWEPNGVDPRFAPIRWQRAVRERRYKLIRDQDLPGDRLFDLWVDPTETVDLIGAGPLSPSAQIAYDSLLEVLLRL